MLANNLGSESGTGGKKSGVNGCSPGAVHWTEACAMYVSRDVPFFCKFVDVVGLRLTRKHGRVQRQLKRNGRLVGQVDLPKAGGEVPLVL